MGYHLTPKTDQPGYYWAVPENHRERQVKPDGIMGHDKETKQWVYLEIVEEFADGIYLCKIPDTE